MPADVFLDTNLFVYQIEALDEAKSPIADRIIGEGIASGGACISFQVVQECLNTFTRKAEIQLEPKEIHDYLEAVLAPLLHVGSSIGLYAKAIDIQDRYNYGFYDALIIAAALEAGCSRLLTEDMQHGQRIEGLMIENPFLDRNS
ncbi:MAG: PIN domain-containing protein [Candidatus Hydrogenedentes bacterium]|nr:PIN domain-containing protein [Candidatus Hydrogenedentota bacterium]